MVLIISLDEEYTVKVITLGIYYIVKKRVIYMYINYIILPKS